MPTKTCAGCSQPLNSPQSPSHARYCQRPECQAARRRAYRERKKAEVEPRPCAHCGKQFTPASTDNRIRYCKRVECRRDRDNKRSRKKRAVNVTPYPLQEWLTGENNLSADELAQKKRKDSVCYACIHLRHCQDRNRRAFEENRIILTHCNF